MIATQKPKRQCKTTAKPAAVSLPIVVVSELVAVSEPVKKRGRPKKIQDPIQLRDPSPVHVAKKIKHSDYWLKNDTQQQKYTLILFLFFCLSIFYLYLLYNKF